MSHSCSTSGCKSEAIVNEAKNAPIVNINFESMNKRDYVNRKRYGKRSIDCKSTDPSDRKSYDRRSIDCKSIDPNEPDPDQEAVILRNFNVSTISYKGKLNEMLNIGTSPVVPTVPMHLLNASDKSLNIRIGSIIPGMVTHAPTPEVED
jgi:hypothetical protein